MGSSSTQTSLQGVHDRQDLLSRTRSDLDLGQVTKAKTFADATGHYSRPDLLWLGADSREKSFITSQVKESSTAKGKKVEDELVDGEANGSA